MTVPKNIAALPALACALCAAAACTNVGDFSTEPGECYVGDIVEAEYIRSSSFDADEILVMTLDADALERGEEGASLTTSKGDQFDETPVVQMTELAHDSLSLLDFPGGRVRNYLAYASPSSGAPATVVISLMESDEIEVRIMRPDLEQNDPVDTSLFGVFRLVRRETCEVPQE